MNKDYSNTLKQLKKQLHSTLFIEMDKADKIIFKALKFIEIVPEHPDIPKFSAYVNDGYHQQSISNAGYLKRVIPEQVERYGKGGKGLRGSNSKENIG